MIKHPDLTALTPVVSTAPPPLSHPGATFCQSELSTSHGHSERPSSCHSERSEESSSFPDPYTLVPENPFGPGRLVAGQQAAALSNLFAAAQALQAAAAELAFSPSSRHSERDPSPCHSKRDPSLCHSERDPSLCHSEESVSPSVLHSSFFILHSSQGPPLAREIGGLFEAFIGLRGCLLDSSLSLSPRLVHDIFSVAHDRATELALVGVTLAADGSIVVDRAALDRAAQASPELLENMFAGPKGLAARLRRLALEVSVSVENIFAAMTPATPGLSTLPSRLAQLFGQALVAG